MQLHNGCQERERQDRADEYEHIKDSTSHHDTQTLDAATAEQTEQQGQITHDMEEEDNEDGEGGDDLPKLEKDEQVPLSVILML